MNNLNETMYFLRSTNIKLLNQTKKINKCDFLRLRNVCHATKPGYDTGCRCPHRANSCNLSSSGLHRHDNMLLQSDASSESASIASLLNSQKHCIHWYQLIR
jgi:hypothetical protein